MDAGVASVLEKQEWKMETEHMHFERRTTVIQIKLFTG